MYTLSLHDALPIYGFIDDVPTFVTNGADGFTLLTFKRVEFQTTGFLLQQHLGIELIAHALLSQRLSSLLPLWFQLGTGLSARISRHRAHKQKHTRAPAV